MTSLPDACDGRPECVVASGDMVAEVQDLVNQGNIRRLAIKSTQGRSLIEIPLRLGVPAAALEPVWNALQALSNSAPKFAVAVHREEAWPRDGISRRR